MHREKCVLDFDSEEQIRRELDHDEELLWCGRPRQGVILRIGDLFFIPFSLLWGGFAVFWEVMAIVMGAPWFFCLWGIPFVAIGLYLVLGRFWVDSRNRASTYYGVTSDRIIIVNDSWSRKVQCLDIRMSEFALNERQNGSGTITFGMTSPFSQLWNLPGVPNGIAPLVPSFELSSEARMVFDVIRNAQKNARSK